MVRTVPDKTTGESIGVQPNIFLPLPAGTRISVTRDNGAEFAHHERLRGGPDMATYFTDPYFGWQRGSNRNRSGMIRRYLPKRCEIRMGMTKEIREIVDEINNYPTRVLGYRTPTKAFADELLELQGQQGCHTSKQTSGGLPGDPPYGRIEATGVPRNRLLRPAYSPGGYPRSSISI